MTQKLAFLLADDHNIVRQGLQFIIEELVDEALFYHASSLAVALKQIANHPIDVLILDAQFPDGNALSVIPEIRQQNPKLKMLVFSSFDEENHALKFLNAGANGFLSKLCEESEIVEALTQLIEKGSYHSLLTKKLLALSAHNPDLLNPLHSLSDRELQIAELYTQGLGNLEIATRLELKQNTVSTFKKRIFEKLNIETFVELIELMKTHHTR